MHTVFTNGCFDIVHFGHLKLLQRCRELGTRVVVGLNTECLEHAADSRKDTTGAQQSRLLDRADFGGRSGMECMRGEKFLACNHGGYCFLMVARGEAKVGHSVDESNCKARVGRGWEAELLDE